MKSYELPEELGADGNYLHPLALKEKWGLTFEQLSEVTGADLTTLRRYSFPDYSKNARRPWRNKPLLILSKVLDQVWQEKGNPYLSA